MHIGSSISHYRIVAKLGEGGMGVVYKAEDTTLERTVALKFLAQHLLNDEEAKERFLREAKAAAALSHPNICTVYEIAEVDGKTFIAMEFVKGETLEERIAAGPLTLKDALDIGRQVADGLEAAHEENIIHRDIKPANVMVDAKGRAKVMDFGLARLTEASRLTKTNTAMGTVAYMSPEHAQGIEVDTRTDIWALGCVLYEMISGQRPFQGQYDQALLYEIVHEEPAALTGLRTGVPMQLEDCVGRCLTKDRDDRYQDVSHLTADLRGLQKRLESGHSRTMNMAEVSPQHVQAGPDTSSGARSWKPRLLPAVAVMLALALVLVSFLLFTRTTPPERQNPQPATRTAVNLPDSARLALGTQYPLLGVELTLSPDGRHLVYVGQADEGTRLYHRDLTRFEDPSSIPGTEGALYAFFSPDSSELGFLTEDRVRKVTLSGGAAVTLCRARAPSFATWIDDTIYFTEQAGSTLARVSTAGGEPSELFNSTKRLGSFEAVSAVLPAGRAALVSVHNRGSISSDYSEIWVVSLEGAEDRALPITGFDARYLPSGHLVFGRGGSLFAVPFDVERLELTGEAVPVMDRVALESLFGNVYAAFANNGTVAFVPGNDLARGRLAWVDRQGNEGVLDVPEQVYGVFDLAPDDRRFAVQVADVRDYVWIWSAEDGGRTLSSPASVGWPVWSPDGTALAVWSKAPGGSTEQLVIQEILTGATRELLSEENPTAPESWVQPDRISGTDHGDSGGIAVLSGTSPRDPLWVRESPSESPLSIWGTALSPDGALIAYGSDEGDGRLQIWVEEIDGSGRRQVSTDGGMEPVWCRACGELFYRWDNRIHASSITQEPRLEISPPREVFEAPGFVDTPGISFRVSSDGERLYYVRRSEPAERGRIHIVGDWFQELD